MGSRHDDVILKTCPFFFARNILNRSVVRLVIFLLLLFSCLMVVLRQLSGVIETHTICSSYLQVSPLIQASLPSNGNFIQCNKPSNVSSPSEKPSSWRQDVRRMGVSFESSMPLFWKSHSLFICTRSLSTVSHVSPICRLGVFPLAADNDDDIDTAGSDISFMFRLVCNLLQTWLFC